MPRQSKLDNPLDIILKKYGKTRYMVRKDTNLSDGLLYNSTKKSVKRHTYDFYEKIGESLGISGSSFMEELIEQENKMLKENKLSEKYKKTLI